MIHNNHVFFTEDRNTGAPEHFCYNYGLLKYYYEHKHYHDIEMKKSNTREIEQSVCCYITVIRIRMLCSRILRNSGN